MILRNVDSKKHSLVFDNVTGWWLIEMSLRHMYIKLTHREVGDSYHLVTHSEWELHAWQTSNLIGNKMYKK